MPIIEMNHLTKKFGSFTAVDSINLSINQGEIYGFIGPNGAGKSTTMQMLLGMLKPTSGTAVIFGKDVWREAVDIHKRLAYVPGDINLWPNLTGGEVIDFLLKMQGEINYRRRDKLIEEFHFDPTKKSHTYSKGNRQKVALIAALATEAELYILDEPTSGLDPLMEKVFQRYIAEAKEAGKTVLLSSHILSEVEQTCDHIAIIREGQIIEQGSLEEMRHLTMNQFIVETEQPLKGLETLKGVHNIEPQNTAVTFQVEKESISEVINYINAFKVTRLESVPPTLEDLFIHHYDKGTTSNPGGR